MTSSGLCIQPFKDYSSFRATEDITQLFLQAEQYFFALSKLNLDPGQVWISASLYTILTCHIYRTPRELSVAVFIPPRCTSCHEISSCSYYTVINAGRATQFSLCARMRFVHQKLTRSFGSATAAAHNSPDVSRRTSNPNLFL